ncbi:MAG: rod shape-determining protein MreC [Alphaproteobacteria bacterium]
MALSFKVKAISRSRFLRNIFLSSIFILSFLLIFFSKSDYFIVNKVKSISNNYFYPITSFFVSPVKVFSQLQNQFYDFRNLKAENNILKEEIMRLKKWQALAIHNNSENKVLKKLLNSTDSNLTLVKTASLVSRNDFMYSKMININAGLKDGVLNNMAVVNYRGLVGRTVDTSVGNSRVLLLTDPNSSIAVKTISNANYSILQGSEDGIHLVSAFSKDEKLPKVGDLVVTSGSAQVFPSNILVGKIVKVTKEDFHVLPFVDFKKIDYVQVVENK